MTTGTVKFFNSAKKFGFITPDDGGKDLYLPAGAIAPADIAKLKAGLRVSFDSESDPKGDKAANLKLLEQKAATAPVARQSITIYLDPAAPESKAVEAAVQARNDVTVLIDYVATPLTVDQLKRLALLLSAAGQNLVHRYHPIFMELQLDDRFISESDYWTAVAEHPTLINGPILVAGARAGICRSQKDVVSFFDHSPKVQGERKPKEISARLAAMMRGGPVASLPKTESVAASVPTTPSPALHKALNKPVVLVSEAKPVAKSQIIKPKPIATKTTPAQKAIPKTVAKKPVKKPAKGVGKPARAAKKIKTTGKMKKKK